MIPELGHFALILAVFVAMALGFFTLAGASKNRPAWMAFGRPAAHVQFALIAISFAALTWSFATFDFWRS